MKNVLLILNKDIPIFDYRVHLGEIQNFQIHFIVPPNNKKYPNIIKHEIELQGGFSLKKDFRGYRKIFKHLLKNNYDIIHYYSSKYYLLGPLLSILTGNKKNIITINGFGKVFTSKKYFILRPLFISILFLSTIIAKKIIVQNHDDLNTISNIFPRKIRKKTQLVYSGISIHSKKAAFNNANLKVINIARITPEKGIKDYLLIAEQVKKYNNKISFLLIGESSGDTKLDTLVNTFNNLGIIRHIAYTNEPYKFLITSDLMLFTSYREGLPRVLLESLAIRLPILAYDVIGVREVVENNYNGILFKKHDYESIIKKICYFDANYHEIKKMSNNSVELLHRKFSMDKYINQMKQILLNI